MERVEFDVRINAAVLEDLGYDWREEVAEIIARGMSERSRVGLVITAVEVDGETFDF